MPSVYAQEDAKRIFALLKCEGFEKRLEVFMGQVLTEMQMVSKCDIKHCGYNMNNNCHAKAITVGDDKNPGCDTFFEAKSHSRESKRIAGVGACKISGCQYNNDFECTAESVSVGIADGKINCLTFSSKS